MKINMKQFLLLHRLHSFEDREHDTGYAYISKYKIYIQSNVEGGNGKTTLGIIIGFVGSGTGIEP